MGRLKKGYNEKARQRKQNIDEDVVEKNKKLQRVVDTTTDLSITKTDDTNLFVTSSKKSEKKKKEKTVNKEKPILTKKQKKNLQRVVDQKKKRERRVELLNDLSKHQVSEHEMEMLHSTASIGHKNVSPNKRKMDSVEEISSELKKKRKRKQKRKHEYQNREDNEEEIVEGILDIESKEISEESSDEDMESTKSISNQQNDIQNVKLHESSPPIEDNVEEEVKENKAEDEKKMNDSSKAKKTRSNEEKKPIYVNLDRTKEILEARLMLPILAEEQAIMELINDNDVVVICGSTGSGKTTQLPQFLYEAGYASHSSHCGLIGITEPRRVAAISMSKRVGKEMNLSTSEVSYQIRYEGNVTDKTKIKFMTDGVLLKEMEKDFYLTKYSAIIIDEAHERSVFTDILIGLLSRVVPIRRKKGNPLKLVIMSATLRVEDFTSNKVLFAVPPPVFSIDSRQYPVTIHFDKLTHEDYITQAFKKVCKIHKSLKLDGGILVFLTGQSEVLSLCRKLKKTFPQSNTTVQNEATKNKNTDAKSKARGILPRIDLDKYSQEDDLGYPADDDDDDDVLMSSDDEIEQQDSWLLNMDEERCRSSKDTDSPMHVLPLYSVLSSEKQAKVFMGAPEGSRLCVVATNVAETSLTIPGIKYIVDSGKVKKKFYDKQTGVSTFRVVWTSKASANQRAGRAGRVEPGHCYRLFSSAVFNNDFEQFSEAEICQRPVEDLVLQMKSMCIDKVINFPFPTPPSESALQAAENLLLHLGALKEEKTKTGGSLNAITSLGKNLSKIPVSPRFGKMILLASKHEGCLMYVICIVAALTVKEIFTDDIDLSEVAGIEEGSAKNEKKLITVARRRWAGEGKSSLLGDMMVILRAVGACEYANYDEGFCKNNGLRHKAMLEIKKLRIQLIKSVSTLHKYMDIGNNMKPPTENQAVRIRQIILSCFADRVARKIPSGEAKQLKLKNAYMSCSSGDPVFIHPISSLFTKLPNFIVYHEIVETKKLYMKSLLAVEEAWLPIYGGHMCTFGKPLDSPPPVYNREDDCVKCYRTSLYGPHLWQITEQLVDYPMCMEYYRWFALHLLQGDVFKWFKKYSNFLLALPSVMVKSWAYREPKVERLMHGLLECDLSNRERLLKKWKENPNYLLKEYLVWLSDEQHVNAQLSWPPNG